MTDSNWTEVGRGVIHPWHHDHYGHMNVRHYAPFFDDAIYHFWAALGLSTGQMADEFGLHTVTAQETTRFLRELKAGDLIVIEGRLDRIGTRSVTFTLRMRHADSGTIHATCEVVEVIFDPATRASAPMPDAMRSRLEASHGA